MDGTVDLEDLFEDDVNRGVESTQRLQAASESQAEDDLAAAERAQRLNWALVLIAAGLASVVAFLAARRASRAMVRPLEQLAQAARTLAGGHLGHRVTIASPAEVREVAETFNSMAGSLQQQRDELERQAFHDALTGVPNRALSRTVPVTPSTPRRGARGARRC